MGTEPNPPAEGGADSKSPGGGQSTSSASGDSGADPQTNSNDKPDVVSRAAYERLLDEKKQAATRLKELEDQKRQDEEKALREKEDFKSLAEKREEELNAERERNAKLSSRLATAAKISAFNDALDGTLERKYWHLIDLDGITVDLETGHADEASVAKAIKAFKAEYGELIKTPNSSGQLPADHPGKGSATTLTHAQWLELPADEKKKRYKDMLATEARAKS